MQLNSRCPAACMQSIPAVLQLYVELPLSCSCLQINFRCLAACMQINSRCLAACMQSISAVLQLVCRSIPAVLQLVQIYFRCLAAMCRSISAGHNYLPLCFYQNLFCSFGSAVQLCRLEADNIWTACGTSLMQECTMCVQCVQPMQCPLYTSPPPQYESQPTLAPGSDPGWSVSPSVLAAHSVGEWRRPRRKEESCVSLQPVTAWSRDPPLGIVSPNISWIYLFL